MVAPGVVNKGSERVSGDAGKEKGWVVFNRVV